MHKSRFGGTTTLKRCKAYKSEGKKYLLVPRFGLYYIINNPKFGLTDCTSVSQIKNGTKISNIEWKGRLTSNQDVISKYLINNIYTKNKRKIGSAGCIVKLETGQGKSYLASYFIGKFKRKTLIIIPNRGVLEQWKNVIYNCYSNITVGEYHSKKKIDGDVMICIINSATSKQFEFKDKTLSYSDFYDQFGYIIYDECHEYANKTGKTALSRAQARFMMGLSATPLEHGKDFAKSVQWHVGKIIDAKNIQGFQANNVKFNCKVIRTKFYARPIYSRLIRNNITETVSPIETINMIAEDPERNKCIINMIEECVDDRLFTFVFAETRKLLTNLLKLFKRHMRERYAEDGGEDNLERDDRETKDDGGDDDIPGVIPMIIENEHEYKTLLGGVKDEDMKIAEEKSKVIFTTYHFMGTGKSIPKMNAIIFATPRRSKIKQFVGRILRLSGDTSIQRRVYDLCDMNITLKNQWSSRVKLYRERKYPIEERVIKSRYIDSRR